MRVYKGISDIFKGEESYMSIKLISGIKWWVTARIMNSLVWAQLSTSIYEDEKQFKIEYYPLTRNIEDLNFENEISRLYFTTEEDENADASVYSNSTIKHDEIRL